ncbi:MAG: hypothetical protein IKE63_05130 [Bacilli bacterium]|nr:hypothetical protein [Bacilli bacterium]
MSKIDIEVTIKNSETTDSYKVKAIVQDNSIKYKEPDDTTVIFDYVENKLIRENDLMKMIYYFNEKSSEDSIILIKDYNRHINLNIITDRIRRKDNDLEIEFEIDKEKFLYRIEEIK